LKALRDSITTACIEALGDNWDERFGELQAFKQRYGHCDVPDKWAENRGLSGWVSWQRQLRKKSQLNEDRIQQLEGIGFTWNPRAVAWEEMFEVLVRYKTKHGDCNVPKDWLENRQLGTWVNEQRTGKKDGTLTDQRFQKLENIGFVWDVPDANWEEMFAALIEYKRKHGDCSVPHAWPSNPQLATWIVTQRAAWRIGHLNENRVQRLGQIGFAWDSRDTLWEEMFTALLKYKRQYGDCNVPKRWKKNTPLATWANAQRAAKRHGKLNDERVGRLNEIGFVWNPIATTKERMFTALMQFRHERGHCNVPQRWPDNPQLATWVATQRRFKKFGKLNEESIRRLEELDFVWHTREASWEQMFSTLLEYQQKYGNCNVPYEWPENPKLGKWVVQQRQVRTTGRLSAERICRLDELGFVYSSHDAQWEEMLETLLEYKRQHGDCNVPNRYRENPKLSAWLNTQRLFKNKGKLTEDRIRRLDQIGFVWNPRDALWEEMFGALLDYEYKHGNCNVARNWS
ncbi:MAG: helicase associated domain-containing protein, partial [Limisphaerales bacterium]